MNIIPYKATAEGTRRYREKHRKYCAPDHFREAGELIVSSIGLGTYLGENDEQTNALVTKAVIESVRRGVNLIDSAIVYRDRQAERSVGKAVRHLLESGEVLRDELIICTKGGILPHVTSDPADWFCQHYIEQSISAISVTDLIDRRYCIHPEYLQDQLNWSLENLGVQTIDVYYIHNPEKHLSEITPDILYERLRAAFEVMEDAVDTGKIAAYGLATWEGFRVPPTSREHLDLARVKSIAQEVSGNKEDSFRFIQFPLNMVMPEALLAPTQNVKGEHVSLLEAAYRLGIIPIASGSIYQAQVVGQIPEKISSAFGKNFRTDCQRALQYTRSAPGLLTALVGMKAPEHVEENLAITAFPSLKREKFQELTHAIVEVLKSMPIDSDNWTFDLSNLSYPVSILNT
ncbi:aldo/keto reductase [Nostoc sp. ChiQUE01b]|uniref:aldo/keto reductase n=1 Tax=Nostoc sp. ChiQUE01b TaxID=3075376 RepID=UPI002AD48FA8|nr:aldo/keto reductase [Nostoc sp. ChiQUE01b]MDZ8262376.1 aldo/keto reductase [Nostoc sp. ChiQUE01b]